MWDVVEGEAGGQTHCCYPPEGEPSVVWSHPVDVHYAAKSLVGWPKMWFQVWHMDDHGLKDLCGYGFCHVPTGPGMHEVEVCTWCPEGTPLEKLQAFFVGGKPRLKYEEVIHSPGDRFRLATRAAGVVMVPPIISERASALTLLRELAQSVRPFAPVSYGYGARSWRGKDPRRSFPALCENRAFSTPTPSAARSRRC